MSVLPPERHPVLLVDANAKSPGLIALQRFEAIPRRDDKVIKTTRGVNQSQLSLYIAPQLSRYAPCRTSVPFAKEIGGWVIGERLNHMLLHTTRPSCKRQVLADGKSPVNDGELRRTQLVRAADAATLTGIADAD
jgi:hypothetical protein